MASPSSLCTNYFFCVCWGHVLLFHAVRRLFAASFFVCNVHLQIWLLSVFIHTSIRTPHPSLSQPTSQSVSQSPIYSPICMHIHACRLFGRWEEATQAAKALFDQRQTRTVARGALAVTPPPTTMRTCMDIYPHTRRRRKHR